MDDHIDLFSSRLFEAYFPMKSVPYDASMASDLSPGERKIWKMIQRLALKMENKGVAVRFVPLYFDHQADVWWIDYASAYVDEKEPLSPLPGEEEPEWNRPRIIFEIRMNDNDKMTGQIEAMHIQNEETRDVFQHFLSETSPYVTWSGNMNDRILIDLNHKK